MTYRVILHHKIQIDEILRNDELKNTCEIFKILLNYMKNDHIIPWTIQITVKLKFM